MSINKTNIKQLHKKTVFYIFNFNYVHLVSRKRIEQQQQKNKKKTQN